MSKKFKFLPVLALGLCWMIGSDARSDEPLTKAVCEQLAGNCYTIRDQEGRKSTDPDTSSPKACKVFFDGISNEMVKTAAQNACCEANDGKTPATSECNKGSCYLGRSTCEWFVDNPPK